MADVLAGAPMADSEIRFYEHRRIGRDLSCCGRMVETPGGGTTDRRGFSGTGSRQR